MRKIEVVCIGKSEPGVLVQARDYTRRVQGFSELKLLELKEYKATKSFKSDLSKKKEGAEILKHISEDDFVVLLDEKGRMMDSIEFSGFIEEKTDGKKLVFVVGGPYGIDQCIRERADFVLSMSKLTFTHQMVRVFLMEQIYRAVSILQGKDYHNQ